MLLVDLQIISEYNRIVVIRFFFEIFPVGVRSIAKVLKSFLEYDLRLGNRRWISEINF